LLEKQDRMIDLLEEILKWARFKGMQRVKAVLHETLKKDSEKIAYSYSDGRGSLEISKLAGVSDFAVRSYWKKWATMGLVQQSSKFKGRYERLFSLEDLGIEVPTIKQISSENEKEMGTEEIKPSGKGSGSKTNESDY
jgi:hypothetical protein